MKIDEVLSLLAQGYGVPRWRPRTDPLSELILTVLSQNTSDTNSRRAFQGLLALPGKGWEAAAEASVEEIARAIHQGGLARVKAPRIKLLLQALREQRGSLDLGFLREMPLPEAKAWLRRLPGVGPKTAACVLLFSLGRPALPVDTHIYRVVRRLGLIDSRVSAEKAHELLEALVPPEDIYPFHVNLIAHGRRVCKAQRPRCLMCLFREGCPAYGREFFALWEKA